MNTNTKALILAAGLGLVSAAQAQVTIYLTGSTAFRAETFTAIKALYDGGAPTLQPASATGSTSKVTYTGTITPLYGAQTVTIKTAFSGSVEGIVNLVGAANPPGITQPTYLNADGSVDSNTTADFGFSDVFQDTSDYNSSLYTALEDFQVGVVCFAWTRGVTAPSTVANISHQQAQQLFAGGTVTTAFFSGNPADTTPIYLTGRNKLSGTRLTYQADCGFGANADATLFKLDGPDAGTDPDLDTVGQTGGGDVRTILTTAGAPAFIGTLGTSDAAAVNSGNNKLTYNGVAFSKAAVQNGQYSLWGYLHLFPRPGTSATKLTLIKGTTAPTTPVTSNGLVKQIDTALSTSANNVQLSTMNVGRNADGGPIFQN